MVVDRFIAVLVRLVGNGNSGLAYHRSLVGVAYSDSAATALVVCWREKVGI